MMLVDSSVWVDFLHAKETQHTSFLRSVLGRRRILTVDLVVMEVLQGTRTAREFAYVGDLLCRLETLPPINIELAVQAAQNYRTLRGKGITIRTTIGTLIATRCIAERIPLLYRDGDFDLFVEHLGLVSALDPSLGVS